MEISQDWSSWISKVCGATAQEAWIAARNQLSKDEKVKFLIDHGYEEEPEGMESLHDRDSDDLAEMVVDELESLGCLKERK